MADYQIEQRQVDEISWHYTVTANNENESGKAGEYIVFTNGMAMKMKDANGQATKQLIPDFRRFIEETSVASDTLAYMIRIERRDRPESLTSSCLLPASNDLLAARAIWRFMAEHLQPGWRVSLLGEEGQLIQQLVSGITS
jgi:hypothetical protein